ncbi:MAG: thioredoxin family protein [Acidobacteria bacterium]|nr:thioredoxin family protein [Acidobacteriota bacterium]
MGLEVVTVSLELSGPDASRPYIDAARPEHPSLLDPTHQMDALFGVVNIPNVVWIDEQGMIVRPPEPGWPGGSQLAPENLRQSLPRMGRAPRAPQPREGALRQMAVVTTGQDRESYPDAIRDWVEKGAASAFALSPAEVVARSQPRPLATSEGAAHFELANHLWRAGQRALAIAHFNECHRLQPQNWTYKRQAYSLVGNDRIGGEFGRFVQGPVEGEEDEWPFDSDFRSDLGMLGEGEFYPNTF